MTAPISNNRSVTWILGLIPITLPNGLNQELLLKIHRLMDSSMKSVLEEKLIDIPLNQNWNRDIPIKLIALKQKFFI